MTQEREVDGSAASAVDDDDDDDAPKKGRSELRRIFHENYDYLWSSLRRLGVHERDLEDITHDVFLEVHKKLGTYDPSRPIRPWLFAFAFRFASDYRKLARHKTELRGDAEAAESGAPSAEDLLATQDSARLLRAALDGLSLELRAVIVLYEIDETPMKDITDALGIPLHTGYSRLRLARAQCAETVKSLMAKEGKPSRTLSKEGGGKSL